MAINENLFLANGNEILKFFRGTKQDFSIEETTTPIKPYKIWTKRDNENLYILDKNNSRIIKLDKEGKIINQYYNAEIAQAQDFTVNEEKKIVYFSTQSKTFLFNLN